MAPVSVVVIARRYHRFRGHHGEQVLSTPPARTSRRLCNHCSRREKKNTTVQISLIWIRLFVFQPTFFKPLHLRPRSAVFFSPRLPNLASKPCLRVSQRVTLVQCVRDFPHPAVAGVNSLDVLHVKGSLGVALVEPRPLAIDCSELEKDSSSGLLTVRLPPSAEEERGSITHHGERHIDTHAHTHTQPPHT